MTVSFMPRESRDYRAVIPFQINGLYNVNVVVTGEGVPLRLDLANPAQTAVSFGGGVIENKHSTVVESTNRVCMKYCIHPECKLCSDIGRVFVLNDPPAHSP